MLSNSHYVDNTLVQIDAASGAISGSVEAIAERRENACQSSVPVAELSRAGPKG
jgi:hypothetical protein